MINNISWTSYGYAILGMALIYYSLVILIYFKQEVRELISGKVVLNSGSGKLSQTNSVASPDALDKSMSLLPENSQASDSIALNALQEEFSAYLFQSSGKPGDRTKIISDLIQIRRKYPQVENKEHQDALRKLVFWECENNCAVTLSEDDLERVWEG